MKHLAISLLLFLGPLSYGFELNCTAGYKGATDSKPYDEVQQKLNMYFENEEFLIIDAVLLNRYFAATYDKENETVFLQIINNADSTHGQTSKSYLPAGKSTGIHEVNGSSVYSLSCHRD